MIDISLLVKPLLDLLSSFGSGVLPADGPASALQSTSSALDQILQLSKGSINQMNTAWDGDAADSATAKALRVQTSAATISDHSNEMATVVGQAAAEVETGQKDLNSIVQSFVDTATALGPTIATPPGLAVVVSSAIDHLGQAIGVVGRVQNELGTQTAAMTELTPPPSTTNALSGLSGLASSATSGLGGLSSVMSTVTGLAGSALGALGTSSTNPSTPSAPGTQQSKPNTGSTTGSTGEGVKITLPDGTEVEAPNKEAATAVKSALGALGTPYVWGGNTPGAGLDCSGLTKFAYGEAGVELPRLAAEQGNGGVQVGPGDVLPGDLAIWDGHVAMVIGNGQFVEAGNPVQISSMRTTNGDMQFYGYYRPTA